MKEKLDLIGPGFCLANWTKTIVNLPNGMTLFCGLPNPIKISESEVENDFNALSNCNERKNSRKIMLEGGKPNCCKYCWQLESIDKNNSDRILRSSEPWSSPFFEEISTSNWVINYTPKYLEIGFSNECNFKCLYCCIEYSTKWLEEITKYGSINMMSAAYNNISFLKKNNKFPKNKSEYNPHIDAFWKWWPELYKELHTFRITGGEPLLAKETWKILDYIINIEQPNRNLNLSINTNLSASDTILNKLIDKINQIIDDNKIGEVIIFASIDSYGVQSEYIRFGLNSEHFWNNVNQILERCPKVTVVISSTYSLLSIFKYDDLIRKIYELNILHNNDIRYWGKAIILNTSLLFEPKFLSVNILFDEDKEIILNKLDNLENDIKKSMNQLENDKIMSIYEYSKLPLEKEDLDLLRKNFIFFIDELDLRRDTNFCDIFPELEKFYTTIKNN